MNMTFRDLIPWNRDRRDVARTIASMSDNPFLSLQRDLNRVFDSFWNETGALMPFSENFAAAMPRTDMSETDTSVDVSVELPGMSEKDLDVSITKDSLTVHGEKKAEKTTDKKDRYLSERSYGVIHRVIALPDGIDSAKAEATYKNGVLTVHLPKTAEAREQARRIDIKTA